MIEKIGGAGVGTARTQWERHAPSIVAQGDEEKREKDGGHRLQRSVAQHCAGLGKLVGPHEQPIANEGLDHDEIEESSI